MKFRLRSLLLFVAFCAFVIAWGMNIHTAILRETGATASGVSSEQANKMLWQNLTLPETATDVAYYRDFGACEAEFSISEKELLKWCQRKGWDYGPIATSTPYFNSMHLPADTREVTHGYWFSPPDGQGVFDRDQSRAGFWVSTFP